MGSPSGRYLNHWLAHLKDLLEARDRLRDLEGWQVAAALLVLKRSLRVFEGNSRELQGFLGDYNRAKGTLETFDVTGPGRIEPFLDETDPLLHNFLAGAESLRDHAKRISDRHLLDLEGDPDTAEYHARERAVFRSPVGSFVRELRNHVLHDQIPTTDGYLMWSADPAGRRSGSSWTGPNSELSAVAAGARQQTASWTGSATTSSFTR